MPKSEIELSGLAKTAKVTEFYETIGFVKGYRLAESEAESKYRKLVEGLKFRLRHLPAMYKKDPNDKEWFMTEFTHEQFVLNHEAMKSLITEIEGGDNDKAESQS